jgi:hypothetical protein
MPTLVDVRQIWAPGKIPAQANRLVWAPDWRFSILMGKKNPETLGSGFLW